MKKKTPKPPQYAVDRLKKVLWKPGTMLFPVPAVFITSAAPHKRPNIFTVAWTGIICSEPPMLSISVRKERHSYELITESRAFVVNLPSSRQLRALDYCGVVSGRTVDKFEQTGLTPGPASTVNAPIILECPINLECKVKKSLELGSHTLFLADITAVQVSEHLITPSGRLAVERAGLITFAHGGYYAMDKKLGFFGFSVQKQKENRKK